MTEIDWQERAIDELEELELKCIALGQFFDSDTYEELPLLEQAKLTTQMYFMTMYAVVLQDRVDNFEPDS